MSKWNVHISVFLLSPAIHFFFCMHTGSFECCFSFALDTSSSEVKLTN